MNNDKPSSESSHSPTEQPGDAKHTPGPWKSSDTSIANQFNIAGVPVHYDPVGICAMGYGRTVDEAKANAELIARAPALLSEVSTLRSKQAELVAEIERLKEGIDVVMSLISGTPTTEDVKMAYSHLYDTRYGNN